MPYLYTLFEETHRTGAPVTRPLWYEFPNDEKCLRKDDAMMLGPAILVHPVLSPGAAVVTVYLPAGVWYDMDTNQKHVGPTTFDYPVTMVRPCRLTSG